jgi:hypothetical protein
VKSAGGPDIQCQHGGPEDDVNEENVKAKLKSAQLEAVSAVANGKKPPPAVVKGESGVLGGEKQAILPGSSKHLESDPNFVASAKAALPHLVSASSSMAAAATEKAG